MSIPIIDTETERSAADEVTIVLHTAQGCQPITVTMSKNVAEDLAYCINQSIKAENCPECEGSGLVRGSCGGCSGSGEGRYDGSICGHCGGSGVEYERCGCGTEPQEDGYE